MYHDTRNLISLVVCSRYEYQDQSYLKCPFILIFYAYIKNVKFEDTKEVNKRTHNTMDKRKRTKKTIKSTQTLKNTEDELICFEYVSCSCSTSGTRRDRDKVNNKLRSRHY